MNRSRLLVTISAALLLAAGCTSVAGTPTRADTPAGTTSTLQPLEDALPVTVHKAVIRPGVVHVPVQQVVQATPDGKTFVLTAAGASGLAVGSVMLIDGIASRKVMAVAPTGSNVTIETTQASTDEIFSDLDVSFDGTPDPSKAVFGVPAESDGPAATIEPIDPDAPTSSAPSTASSSPSTGPTRLRGPGRALADPSDARLTVVKKLAGNTGAAAGKTFVLTVDCSTNGTSDDGFPLSLSFSGAGSQQIGAPVGSTCSVTEPDPQGAVPTLSDPVAIAASGGDFRLTVTNTFAGGGGDQPGNQPNQPGNQPGNDPGQQPGDQPNQPGDQPGNDPGQQPGDQPGDQPGQQPGNAPNGPPARPDIPPTPSPTTPKRSPSPTATSPSPTSPSPSEKKSPCSTAVSFTVPLKGYSVTASIARNTACTGYDLNADISSASGALASSIGVHAEILDPAITGRLTAGATGASHTTTSVTLNGTLTVGGDAGAGDPGGYLARAKLSWDALKVDWPFVVLGVPFLVRIGVAASIEFRLSGQHDTVSAQFISGKCQGTVTMPDLSKVGESTCVMQTAKVNSFLTLAPSGMVVAAGFKVGIGPGVVVPFALPPVDATGKVPLPTQKSVAFAGITGTLALAVGLTTTGATSIGVRDCLRTDRSVQLIGSADATLGPFSASIAHTFWGKTATDYSGPRCPQGG